MRRRCRAPLLALAAGLLPTAALAAALLAPVFSFPDGAAIHSLPSRTGLAVLESLSRRVLTGALDGNRLTGLSPLPGPEAPVAIASDETGLLLVIEKTAKGHQLRRYRNGALEGRPVELPTAARREVAGAAARNGILWLALRKPSGLMMAAYDGQLLAEPAPPSGPPAAPFSVALDEQGRAYVTDPMGPALYVFSPSGTFESRRDLRNTGFTRPTGVAVDPKGVVLVSDGVTGRLGRLAPEGAVPALTFAEGRFDDPLRLFADPRGLLQGVWVLEGRTGQIHVEGR